MLRTCTGLSGSLGSAALLEGRGSLVFHAELGLCRIDEVNPDLLTRVTLTLTLT